MTEQPTHVPANAYISLLNRHKALISAYSSLAKDKHLPSYPFNENDESRSMLLAHIMGTPVPEAIYIIDALNKTRWLEGDVCEFGVAQGATSALIANEIRATDKTLWLYDSFQGLPAPSEQDELKDDIFNLGSMDAYKGTMHCAKEMVLEKLDAVRFPPNRYRIIEGFIEDYISDESIPATVSFAYVDFDFYQPIKIALELLDKRLAPGGIIIVDDYDFFSTGAKLATDEFVENCGGNYRFEVPDSKLFGHFSILTKHMG